MMRPRGGFTSYVGYGVLTLILMYVLFLYNATKNGLSSCHETGQKLKDDKQELLSHLSVSQEYTKRMKVTVSELKDAQERCHNERRDARTELETCHKQTSDLKGSLSDKETEYSNLEVDVRNLRTELREKTEDCQRVQQKSYQEYATLQKEKEQIENSFNADLAKKVAEIQTLQEELANLKQQAAAPNHEVNPGQGGQAAFLGQGGQAALPVQGGQAALPGQGGQAVFPGQGGQAVLPGQGQAALPGQGGQAALPGQGGQAALPGQGGQAALSGQGGQAALSGQGGQAALPGQGGQVNNGQQNILDNALPLNTDKSLKNNNLPFANVDFAQGIMADNHANQNFEQKGGAAQTNAAALGNNRPAAVGDLKQGDAADEQPMADSHKTLGDAGRVVAFNSPTKAGLLGNIVRRAADRQEPEEAGQSLNNDPAVVLDKVLESDAQEIVHVPDRYGGVKKGGLLAKDTNVVQKPLGIMGDDLGDNSKQEDLDQHSVNRGNLFTAAKGVIPKSKVTPLAQGRSLSPETGKVEGQQAISKPSVSRSRNKSAHSPNNAMEEKSRDADIPNNAAPRPPAAETVKFFKAPAENRNLSRDKVNVDDDDNAAQGDRNVAAEEDSPRKGLLYESADKVDILKGR
ncbi:uncharacterized protein [Watersipora subatra]|uniref:uncharacterized protein isoform X3 n=1 Tax=Watersipora subatra TaxID=2589382 RepID=UPI00355C4525